MITMFVGRLDYRLKPSNSIYLKA